MRTSNEGCHWDDDDMERGDDRDKGKMENGRDDHDVCGKHDDRYDRDDRDYDREDAHREAD